MPPFLELQMLANNLCKTIRIMYILIFIIVVVIALLYTTYRKEKEENKKVSPYPKKRERRYRRESRRIRHHKTWLILRYLVTMQDLCDSSNFHELQNRWEKHLDVKKEMANEELLNEHFNIAFRFCKIEYEGKRCKRHISIEEQQTIRNWRDYSVDISRISMNVIARYELYWDDVLSSYKRANAKINRIKYLVEELDEIKKESLMQVDEIQKCLITLQKKYSDELIQLEDKARE